MNELKPLVIFHDHCTDGFGAAFAAWMKFGDEAEYVPMSYGDKRVEVVHDELIFPVEITGREVYVLDFSFSREVTEALIAQAGKFSWLDHHKTAFEMWCETEREYCRESDENLEGTQEYHILLDNNKSGALLAWEYFHPGTEVPMMIKHIDDRDRWQFKIEGSKEFHAALASYKPWSFEQWKTHVYPASMGSRNATFEQTALYSALMKEGSAILRAHEQNVKSVVAGGKRDVTIPWKQPDEECGYIVKDAPGLSANCPPHLASDVGHELANESGAFGLCWYMGRDGKAKASLRSNGDYDVSAIAKSLGGGGHRNAAGFEIDMTTLIGWMK